jgi:ABC-type multidrug transport system fused ATPase/permease subunit
MNPINCNQFMLLIAKNGILGMADFGRTVGEIIVPLWITSVLLLVYAMSIIKPGLGFSPLGAIPPFDIGSRSLWLSSDTTSFRYVTEVLPDTITLKQVSQNNLTQCESSADCWGALVCNPCLKGNLNFTIRLPSCGASQLNKACVPDTSPTAMHVSNILHQPYVTSGFVWLQLLLNNASLADNMQPEFQAFSPSTAAESTRKANQRFFQSTWGYVGPIILCFMFAMSSYTLSSMLVLEKETKLNELMRMMGMNLAAYNLSFFVYTVALQFLPLMLASLILRTAMLQHVPYTTILAVNVIYGWSFAALSFVVAAAWSTAASAGIVSIFVYFALVVVGMVVDIMEAPLTNWNTNSQNVLNLLSPAGFVLAQHQLGNCEFQAIMANSPVQQTDCGVAHLCWVCLADVAVYLLLAWYLSQVLPSQWGAPRPWCFPLQDLSALVKNEGSSAPQQLALLEEAGVEAQPGDNTSGVISGARVNVRSLVKKYGDFCAVDKLTFRANAGEILTLLGHNGAGKTTTIHMLTGLVRPTSGDALVNGHSIVRDVTTVRRSLGLCPQHDVLWDQLTVRQTLVLWTGLKGLTGWLECVFSDDRTYSSYTLTHYTYSLPSTGRSLFRSVATLLADTGLENKAHVRTASLSGMLPVPPPPPPLPSPHRASHFAKKVGRSDGSQLLLRLPVTAP